VLLVSGNDAPRAVEPGRVPDALARDFASDYVVHFESYSPVTIDASSVFTRGRVAPSMLHDFTRLLENRRKLVVESGLVSQVLLENPAAMEVSREGARLDVILRALRRVYVADKLAQEARVIYRVALESGEPTRDNPTGLLVLGVSAKVQATGREGGPRGQ
jgi:hypothetical protein